MDALILSDNDYSIYAHSSLLLNCRLLAEPETEKEKLEGPTYKHLINNFNFYLVAIGNSTMALRRATYVGWLGTQF